MQETPVRFLGWEDPQEKGKATHCSILAWRTPWTVYSPWVTKSQTQLSDFHFHTFYLARLPFGEGNGSPLQCSCLENPRDGGAWWAAVYGVTQSRTRLKRLSSSGGGGSTVKNLPAMPEMRETWVQSWIRRTASAGNGNSRQYPCLENPMDRGAWRPTVHGLTKGWI